MLNKKLINYIYTGQQLYHIRKVINVVNLNAKISIYFTGRNALSLCEIIPAALIFDSRDSQIGLAVIRCSMF